MSYQDFKALIQGINLIAVRCQHFSFNLVKNKCLLIISLVFSAFSAHAHETSIEHFKKLSNIIQDDEGYIWATGHNGVTRFDGERTITFAQNSTDWQVPFIWSHNLTPQSNMPNAKMVVATENRGIWFLDPQTGKSQPIDDSVGDVTVYEVAHFNNNIYFYAVSPNALYQYAPSTKKTKKVAENIRLIAMFNWQNQLFWFQQAIDFSYYARAN